MVRNIDKYIVWRQDPSWYEGDPRNPHKCKLTEKAPEEARKSFELWQKEFGDD